MDVENDNQTLTDETVDTARSTHTNTTSQMLPDDSELSDNARPTKRRKGNGTKLRPRKKKGLHFEAAN